MWGGTLIERVGAAVNCVQTNDGRKRIFGREHKSGLWTFRNKIPIVSTVITG